MRRGILLSCLFLLLLPLVSFAQSPNTEPTFESREVKAIVTRIIERSQEDEIPQAVFEAKLLEGEETYRIDTSEAFVEGLRYRIEPGTRIVLQIYPNGEGGETAQLTNIVRTRALFWLFLLFAIVAIAIGRWRGFFALIGLGVTIAILFLYVFPQILGGANPVVVTVIGSIVILAVNMHLSHGISKSTLYAFLSTVIGLGLALLFAELFVSFANLSGLGNEEAAFVYFQSGAKIAPQGILLAGIILGATGVLDDIAITQTEAVHEIRAANKDLDKKELFRRAMRLGRHHIASTVNTLVLAYVGVAMPIFLLFLSSSVGIGDFFNTEIVSEEIVRTLAGTFALVLTVPIATWFATFSKHTHEKSH